MIAAGVMVAAAMIFAGWGLTQIATGDDDTSIVAPADPQDGAGEDDTATVTLPDRDRDSVPDDYEGPDGGGIRLR
ncbi:hypothetical protein [Streptomyces sp. NPDC007083]|uniref:hypothetical protein n=1 Tax=Streptomyces sp. NPDC007083 TaxID=3156913 RepID=UPI00340316F4